MNKERLLHIDVARGIAILLVVLGHCCTTTEGALNRMVLSFHMPLFFFLSGVFARKIPASQFWGGVLSKTKRLLLPQIVLGITLIILKGTSWVAHGNSLHDFDFLRCFVYWFLPTLWFCSIIYISLALVIKFENPVTKVCSVSINLLIIFLTLNFVDADKGNLFEDIRILPVAYLFYSLGSFTKTKTISLPREPKRPFISLVLLIATPLLFVISQLNTPVRMYRSDFGDFVLFLITSILGIFISIELSKHLSKTPLLAWLGKASIAVYVWNFLIIGIIRSILSRSLDMVGMHSDSILTALIFIFSLIILIAICKFTLLYIPFIYGQRRNKN